ncbi:MAG: hypothetical protein EBU90_31785 [Proteobacteria bacterium]|nr:hypothetical protein [Pseudomonadota bacterium]
MSKYEYKETKTTHVSEDGLRDIFAALAMLGLMQQNNPPVPKWVAHQAYKYADAMLDERDGVSNNMENNK